MKQEYLELFEKLFSKDIKDVKLDDKPLLKELFEYFSEDLYLPNEKYIELKKQKNEVETELEKSFTDNQSNLFIKYWYLPTAIIVGIITAILVYVNTPKGKYNFDYFKYTMPVFGKLIFALDFSRLMKAMYLNIENGMRIQDSLEVSKNVVKNYVMLSIIETSINNMITGYSWIDPFEKSGLCSPMTTEMLKIGMQTDLTEMLSKLLEYMDMDINNSIEKIVKIMPEIVYSIVGIVLIFFVVVILVPVIQVYMGNFLFDAYL